MLSAPSSRGRQVSPSLRILCGILTSAGIALLALPGLTGCPASACPLPKTSALTITPAPPSCLTWKLSSCAHATIELDNACSEAVYVPVDYGIFADDQVAGTELEVRGLQNLVYEVRNDKATVRTSKEEDYSVPFRIGKDAYTMTFSIYSDS